MGPVIKLDRADRLPIIAVIGASSAPQPVLDAAYTVGRGIALEGWHLLTGGGGGVMEAASRGFVENRTEGGVTIGLLPTEDAGAANPYVEIPIPTGMGYARNAVITRTAAGLIAIGGCSGTLSEIAFAWQEGRPIAALQNTGGWAAKLAGTSIDPRRDDVIFAADDAPRAIQFLRENIKAR
jgi:uncharacterized protein (TIGR00725 family)